MCKLLIALIAVAALTGCAKDAYYVDQEWGKAQTATWNMQLAAPDPRYAGKTPAGMEGINAEEVMDVYNRSFTEKTTATNIFELGITGENSGK